VPLAKVVPARASLNAGYRCVVKEMLWY